MTQRRRCVRMNVLTDLWGGYLSSLDAQPLLTKCLTSGVILPAADIAAQLIEKRGDPSAPRGIDFTRTSRWLAAGFLLHAPWNHYWYNFLDARVPPPTEPLSGINFLRLALDQFLQAPVFTALFFAVLQLLEGANTQGVRDKLSRDWWSTMKTNWVVWLPASFINLAFVPTALKLLYVNVVFYFWSIFLSIVANRDVEPQKQT
ncbi:unnamed protein product [Vitrella brassicaformis CCMP3155]|uniref:Peroxisomal membrane protein 2 n=2 Tax=Vitrella brassicaformis TaxID=1169539 RepID=A0A0G4ELV0_VITBC|nr:unnamed protein product [Vitrella brassicaformis CCMP3155]|eukprot:CEL98403.1 unnamed protein product [Vitrella brassicaformis CCMP3155]